MNNSDTTLWTADNWKRWLTRSVTALLIGAAFIYIYNLVAKDWDRLAQSIADIQQGEFIASILVAIIAKLFAARFYALLLQRHSAPSSWAPVFKVFLLSQIIKYVPGKIWSYLYQINSLPDSKTKTAILLTNMELMLISIWGISGISAVALYSPNFTTIILVAVLLSVIAIQVFKFRIIDIIINKTLGYLRTIGIKASSNTTAPRQRSHLLPLALWMLLTYLSVFLLIDSIWNLSQSDVIIYTSCLLLSWVFGLLIIVVPAGVGVQEAGFVLAATYFLGVLDPSQLAITAIVARFWFILIDLACGIIGMPLRSE